MIASSHVSLLAHHAYFWLAAWRDSIADLLHTVSSRSFVSLESTLNGKHLLLAPPIRLRLCFHLPTRVTAPPHPSHRPSHSPRLLRHSQALAYHGDLSSDSHVAAIPVERV